MTAVGWRELYNEELPDFYSSLDIYRVIKSRRMKLLGSVGCRRQNSGLLGKPEANRPLGRPSHRWEDNIKMDL
jgi:hypothetical protein